MSAEDKDKPKGDFDRPGIIHPDAPGAEDHARLVRYLVEHGATEKALAEATARQRLGGLALDLALTSGTRVPFAEAVEEVGLTPDGAVRLWRALGFPDADDAADPPSLPPDAVRALRFFGTSIPAYLGPETSIALCRVLGSSSSRMAEAVVDAFRLRYELPQRAQGRAYSQIVEDYAALANSLLPDFLESLAAIFRRHLVAVASTHWWHDEEGTTPQRDLVIGFVDLVSYTALSRTLSPRQLADLIGRFEAVVEDTLAKHGARLVKLLGDGAMFASEDGVKACRLALDLVHAIGADDALPAARIGLAAGSVVALYGDYQGPVVNIAARLVGAAPVSGVVVDENVEQAAQAAFRFSPYHVGELKGFLEPPPMFLVDEPAATT